MAESVEQHVTALRHICSSPWTQLGHLLLCRQASSSAGTRGTRDPTQPGMGLKGVGWRGGTSFSHNVHMPCLERQVLREVSRLNKPARKSCFHAQLPTPQTEDLTDFLRRSMRYLCACRWSWSLWETGWLWASVAHYPPLQPPVDWQFCILLIPSLKGRSLEG